MQRVLRYMDVAAYPAPALPSMRHFHHILLGVRHSDLAKFLGLHHVVQVTNENCCHIYVGPILIVSQPCDVLDRAHPPYSHHFCHILLVDILLLLFLREMIKTSVEYSRVRMRHDTTNLVLGTISSSIRITNVGLMMKMVQVSCLLAELMLLFSLVKTRPL